tara:strand:+ start:1285 stop:2700 length:1416 start_codon:yes stop_codon:yes gene_type:complete
MKLEQFHPDIISTEDINRLLEQRFGMQIDVDSITAEDRTLFLEALRKANDEIAFQVGPLHTHNHPKYQENAMMIELLETVDGVDEEDAGDTDDLEDVVAPEYKQIIDMLEKGKSADDIKDMMPDQAEMVDQVVADIKAVQEKFSTFGNDLGEAQGFRLSGSEAAALRLLVGNTNYMRAIRALEMANRGQSVPSDLMKGFMPILDHLQGFLRGGVGAVNRFKQLAKLNPQKEDSDSKKGDVAMNTEAKKTDQDKDGDNDFADIMIARMVKGGMSKADAIKKVKGKKYNEQLAKKLEGVEDRIRRAKLKEGQMEQAELAMAAKDMVDKLTGMLEDIGQMQNEDLLPISDSIRSEMGEEVASSFAGKVETALGSLLDSVKSARTEMEDASRIVTGETTPDDTMGADTPTDDKPGDDLGDLDDLGSDDELDDIEGTDAAAGGTDPEGREKRESVEDMYRKKISEASDLYAKLSKK